MTHELLPCPFCGVRPTEAQWGVTMITYSLRCDNCDCEMEGDSKHDLTERWNTRVAHKLQPVVQDCLTTDHAEIAQLRARVAELGKIIIECERELDIHCVCPYCSRDYMGDNHHPGCALAAVVKDCLTTESENL